MSELQWMPRPAKLEVEDEKWSAEVYSLDDASEARLCIDSGAGMAVQIGGYSARDCRRISRWLEEIAASIEFADAELARRDKSCFPRSLNVQRLNAKRSTS